VVSTQDYNYDNFGNQNKDDNKGITNIKYNHLNLPTEIIFAPATPVKKINYLYSATGEKLQKTVTNGTSITITDYLGGFQYIKVGTAPVVLQYFPHPEGYVNYNTGVYKHVFNYKDHLDNVRVSYTKDDATGLPVILEQNHYYPFGLKHTNYNTTLLKLRGSTPVAATTSVRKYRHRSYEFQDELGLNWYDFGMRGYMPDIGRWGGVDMLAETSRRFSPYAYCLNNPVYFIDVDGMYATPPDWYQNNKTGDVVWREGSGKQAGYTNIGHSTNLASGTGQNVQLNGNGTFKDLNSGKSYGNNETVVYNTSTGNTVTSKQNWSQRNLVIEASISGSVGLQVGGKAGAIEGSAGVLKQEIGKIGYDFVNNKNTTSFAESKTENFVEGSIGIKGTPLSAGGGANYNYASPDGLNGMNNGTLGFSGQIGLDSGKNLLPNQPALNVSPNAKASTDCNCIDIGAGVRAIFGISVDLKIGIKK
jgi:RHS repeat-associated protein